MAKKRFENRFAVRKEILVDRKGLPYIFRKRKGRKAYWEAIFSLAVCRAGSFLHTLLTYLRIVYIRIII